MTRAQAIAALALVLCATASADEFEGRAHTHWWLDLPQPALYAGASVVQSRFTDWELVNVLNDGSYVSASEDAKDNGIRVFGAVEFGYVGVELGYADLGEAAYVAQSDGSGSQWAAGPVRETLAASGYDLSLVGRLPVGEAWALFARVGRFIYQVDGRVSATTQSSGPARDRGSESDAEMLYGGGIEYRLPASWRLMASYQTTDIENPFANGVPRPDAKLDSVSLSVAYVWGPAR